MPDKIFSDPDLVQIYDAFDGGRDDLTHYLNIAKEFKAKTVLDIGCGTGCFALLLAQNGLKVIGVDPALESIKFAQQKPLADKVQWLHGDSSILSDALNADIAFMTGNVAQVFLSDEEWLANLRDIKRAFKNNGTLVFEARKPHKKAWESWVKDKTLQTLDCGEIGAVTGWTQLDKVDGEYISFTHSYEFHKTGAVYKSHSTLRFRDKETIEDSLNVAGYDVVDIREAPDRPDLEYVFIARGL
jgi:ubiquinone/menaquinone biosynthesis C-methylase UbiE